MNTKLIQENLARGFKSTVLVNEFSMDHDQYVPTRVTFVVNSPMTEKPVDVDPVLDRDLIRDFSHKLETGEPSGYFLGRTAVENMVFQKKNAGFRQRRDYLDINDSGWHSSYLDDVLTQILPNPQMSEMVFDMKNVDFIKEAGLQKFAKILLYLQANAREDIQLHMRQATTLMQRVMHQRGLNPHYTVHIER